MHKTWIYWTSYQFVKYFSYLYIHQQFFCIHQCIHIHKPHVCSHTLYFSQIYKLDLWHIHQYLYIIKIIINKYNMKLTKFEKLCSYYNCKEIFNMRNEAILRLLIILILLNESTLKLQVHFLDYSLHVSLRLKF